VELHDLGPLEITDAAGTRPVGGARLEAALALLLIHAGETVGPDALAEALWGERGVERSAGTLDSHVWRLRRALEPDRERGAPSAVLRKETGGYRLVVPPERIDSVRYARAAAEAAPLLAAGDAAGALDRAEAVAPLWRGRPFGTAADEPWASAAVARLEEVRGALRETHIAALLATGGHEAALAALETALAEEPLRERLWTFRMRALRAVGRRSEALAAYARARAALVEELGIEPGPELRAAHAEVLREEEPAPVAFGAAPPLPRLHSRTIGRAAELAEVRALLAANPLVTLTGAAGCGKTRLAVEAAAAHPDGAWFVDLTSATSDTVVDAAASALELSVSASAGDPIDVLRRAATGRLLVLDNCEHVLDAAADLADGLVGSGATLLATSREPLEVAGERVLGLLPLPADAAVELFLDRLAAPPASLTRVREIAEAVDGLPLALELAAGRAGAYTLDEVAAQVRADASALSRVGRGRGRSHHRTVREAIDSSYRDLPAHLAAVHRAVGAVPGPFSAALAEGLVGEDVTDALAELAHRSLLTSLGPARTGGASRFAQLATVRGHALHLAERAGEHSRRDEWVERLARSRPAPGSHRHVGWYRAVADDLAAVRATLHHTLVEAPSATGVAVAARLWMFWSFHGGALEGPRWLRAAAGLELGERAERAAVLVDLGCADVVQGRPAGRESIRAGIATGLGDDTGLVAAALTVSAGVLARVEDLEVLTEVAAAVAELAPGTVQARHVELIRRTIAGPTPELVGRYAALHETALAEDDLFVGWQSAANAARLLVAAGRAAEAVPLARAAVRTSAEAGLRDNAYALEVYGAALGLAGEPTAALRVFGAVEAQHRGAGVPWPREPQVAELLTALRARLGPAGDRLRAEGARATLLELAQGA
jgi:predicted ATPase/DNA-binding SARP family transcriptional activator